jgi:hypothetical protein
MTVRRRVALVALVAVVLAGLGLASGTAAQARPSLDQSAVTVTHGVRAAVSSGAPAERRWSLQRAGWLAHASVGTAGWVRVLTAEALNAGDLDAPTCCRSRAPPS